MNFTHLLDKLNREINAKSINHQKVRLILIELIQNTINGKQYVLHYYVEF